MRGHAKLEGPTGPDRGRKAYAARAFPRPMPDSKPPATFIADLRPSRVATLEATVSQLEPVREIETRGGGKKKVRNGKLKDATGEISLVLWGAEVDMVQEGERVAIVEGWVSDYRGRPQISLGRGGRIEKRATSG
jgi:hypothetical protein